MPETISRQHASNNYQRWPFLLYILRLHLYVCGIKLRKLHYIKKEGIDTFLKIYQSGRLIK